MKLIITVLAVMFFVLQWRLWVGDGGVREVQRHQTEINRLSEQLEEQRDINSALRAEVRDLQDGLGEIEERARSELGMIGDGETFYQFVGGNVDSNQRRNQHRNQGGDDVAGLSSGGQAAEERAATSQVINVQ